MIVGARGEMLRMACTEPLAIKQAAERAALAEGWLHTESLCLDNATNYFCPKSLSLKS